MLVVLSGGGGGIQFVGDEAAPVEFQAIIHLPSQ